jgi:oxygen-independent coproporphyrinogen III oxidase
VSQIHFGGGTPNAIEASMLKELVELVAGSFSFIDKPEIAIECNPAYLTFEYVDALKEAGFNRFSLGIQDFNDDVLRTVNRDSSHIPVDELVAYIKKERRDISVNLDFIYGLPGQTVESFLESVAKAATIRPDRLVTFSYAHVPWMKKHQMILEKRGLPSSEVKMEMFLSAYELLKQEGYQPVGLDHFVLPTDELFTALEGKELHRNFQGYCIRRTTGQVYAFGVTAISQLEMGYAQNVKDIAEYIATIENHHLPIEKGYALTQGEMVTREAITELMCNKRVSWSDVASKLGVPAEEVRTQIAVNKSTLAGFAADGLISYTPDEITVTELGSIFIRNVAASLDSAYQQQANSYSKTV